MVCIGLCIGGGTDDYIDAAGPASGEIRPIKPFFRRFYQEAYDRKKKARRINLGRRPDHNLDRNGADDGTGASDIRPRDDNGGSRKRRNSKVCLADIRG